MANSTSASCTSLVERYKRCVDFWPTNSVDIFLDSTMVDGRKLVIDNVHDVADVYPTSTDTSGNENWRVACSETSHSSLPVPLSAVAVNRDDRQLGVPEKVVQIVDLYAAVDKDDSANTRHLLEKVDQGISLATAVNLDDILLNVCSGTSSSTHAKSNMRLSEVLLGQFASFSGEGCREKTEFDIAFILL